MTDEKSILNELMAECRTRSIRLAMACHGRLTIDAPQSALTIELLARLKANKSELLASLEELEERAAIIEFDANLSRRDAERLAARV